MPPALQNYVAMATSQCEHLSLLIPTSFLLPGSLPVLKAHPAMGSAGLGTAAAQGRWGVGHKLTPRVNLPWVNSCQRLLKWKKKTEHSKGLKHLSKTLLLFMA